MIKLFYLKNGTTTKIIVTISIETIAIERNGFLLMSNFPLNQVRPMLS